MGNQCCVPKQPNNSSIEKGQPIGGNQPIKSAKDLKNHLDAFHFALAQRKQDNKTNIICLICDFVSTSLEAHQTHLKIRHKYILGGKKNPKVKVPTKELHKSIKDKVQQIKKQQVKQTKPGRAIINGNQYQVISYEREYGAVQFDHDKAKGDTIWRYVFTKYKDADYFQIDHQPAQKSIITKGKIFIKMLK